MKKKEYCLEYCRKMASLSQKHKKELGSTTQPLIQKSSNRGDDWCFPFLNWTRHKWNLFLFSPLWVYAHTLYTYTYNRSIILPSIPPSIRNLEKKTLCDAWSIVLEPNYIFMSRISYKWLQSSCRLSIKASTVYAFKNLRQYLKCMRRFAYL